MHLNVSAGPTPPCAELNHNIVTFRIAMYVFLGSCVCAVGLVGNVMAFIVLHRQIDKKNSTIWLLQVLAAADSLYLIASFLIQTLQTIKFDTDWWPAFQRTYPKGRPYVWPIASILQTITVWMVILITVDRYIVVTKPLSVHTTKPTRVKLSVPVIVIAATLYNIPRFFEKEIVTKYNSCTNKTEHDVVKTPLRLDQSYFIAYHVVLHCLFRTIGPLVTLLILNIRLMSEFKKAQKARYSMTGKTAHHANFTLIVAAVVTVFIICELPDAVLRIVAVTLHSDPREQQTNDYLLYFNVISNSLLTVNSAVNFSIYCFTGTKFRRDAIRLFCYCDWTRRSRLMSSVTQRTISYERLAGRSLSYEGQFTRTISRTPEVVRRISLRETRI